MLYFVCSSPRSNLQHTNNARDKIHFGQHDKQELKVHIILLCARQLSGSGTPSCASPEKGPQRPRTLDSKKRWLLSQPRLRVVGSRKPDQSSDEDAATLALTRVRGGGYVRNQKHPWPTEATVHRRQCPCHPVERSGFFVVGHKTVVGAIKNKNGWLPFATCFQFSSTHPTAA